MKKILLISILSGIYFSFFLHIASADNFIYKDVPNLKLFYEDQPIPWATNPVMVEQVLYAPLRDILPAMGISLYTNRRTLKTTIMRYSDNFKAELEEGSPYIYINEKKIEMVNPTRIIQNRVYIPVEEFMGLLGYSIKNKDEIYYIRPSLLPLIKKGRSYMISSLAPFVYDVDFDKDKSLLRIELRGVAVNKSHHTTKDKGVESITLAPSKQDDSMAIIEVKLARGAKYVLYKYEGNSNLELEIIPPPESEPEPAVATASGTIVATGNVKETSKEAPKVIKTTGSFEGPSRDAIWLPRLKARSQIVFSISGQELLLKAPYLYVEGSLMVPLKSFFEKAGYTVYINFNKREATVIRDDGIDYLLKANQKEIVDRRLGVSNAMSVGPVIYNNDMYVPLIAFTRIIGMGIRWDTKQEKVFINHRIYEVVYEEFSGMRQITFKCTGEIYIEKVFEQTDVLFLEIHNTNLDVPNPIVEVDDDKVKSIRLAQLTNNTCRVAIDTKGKVPYGIISNDNILDATIRFVAGLSNISLKTSEEFSQISIDSSSAIKPVISKFVNPYRLVIDVPDTVLKVPESRLGDGRLINRVRASQFQWNPLVTRIVIDLTKDVFYKVQKTNGDKSLSILISQKTIGATTVVEEKKLTVMPVPEAPKKSLLKGKIICVEAGHGGLDPGSLGLKGTLEKEITLRTSQFLEEELSKRGASVIMARESDVFMNLYDRVMIANRNKADLFISVHYNSFTDDSVSGTETFYYKATDYWLSYYVHKYLAREMRRTDKGLKKNNLYVLRHTDMPAVLVEPLFISNKWDEMLTKNDEFQKKIAYGITEGVEHYFEQKKKQTKR